MKIMRDVSLCLCLMGTALFCSPGALADDCTPATEAAIAQAKVPHGVTHVMTAPGKPPDHMDMIFLDDKTYVRMNGKWSSMPFSAKDQIETIKTSREHAEKTPHTCQKIAGQSINGEAASLFVVHSETNGKVVDARLWISDTTGLPLKSEIKLGSGTEVTDEFRYGDIKAPADVK